MAHELAQIDGRYSYAFTGERSDIWHREGQQMPETATVREMTEAAGFDFKLCPTRVRYNVGGGEQKVFENNVILVHNQTREGLVVVGRDFQIVQPQQAVELAELVAKAVDGRVDSCGVTFGGLGMFLNIRVGESIKIVGDDVMMPNILFATRNDGTLSSTLKASNVRAVCNNTVQAALGSHAHARDYRLTHRSEFKPDSVAAFWEAQYLLHKSQVESFKMLSQTPMATSTAEALVFNLFNNLRSKNNRQDPTVAKVEKGKQDIRNATGYKTILSLFNGAGRGAKLPGVRGTAWGMFNAVTEYVDHHAQAKDASQRWFNANFGKGVDMKGDAFDRVMTFAEESNQL